MFTRNVHMSRFAAITWPGLLIGGECAGRKFSLSLMILGEMENELLHLSGPGPKSSGRVISSQSDYPIPVLHFLVETCLLWDETLAVGQGQVTWL